MTLLAQSIQTSKYTPVSGNFLSSSYPNNSNPPVDGDGTSDFVIDNSTVFSFDRTAYPLLAKGATAVDVITGATVQRMTAPGDLALTSSSVNGYSRNSQVNCDKTHYFNFSTNSFSSAIHLMSDKSVVIQPAYDGSGINSHSIGMSHEMRWHATDPNIFYYRHNNTLRKFDIRLTNTQNARVTSLKISMLARTRSTGLLPQADKFKEFTTIRRVTVQVTLITGRSWLHGMTVQLTELQRLFTTRYPQA